LTVTDDPVNAFVPHSPPPKDGKPGGPLSGLTFGVKDLYDTEGDVTGGGNPEWLASHEAAEHTSPLVQSLLDAGARLVGKTVCCEFFYSITGANAHYGTPKNARAPGRLPGGSSSGSAAAVAAGLCDFALGSDTGGSVRVPASFCGLYGLRPTHGRLDLAHAMSMAPSFDTAGWFADNVENFRAVGQVLLGEGGLPGAVDRVLLAEFAFAYVEADTAAALKAFLNHAAQALPNIEVVAKPPGALDLEEMREAFRILQAFETWQSFGAWIDKTDPDLGPGIKERMRSAGDITDFDRDQAQPARSKLVNAFKNLVPPGTVLLLPAAPSPAPRTDEPEEVLNKFRLQTMSLTCLASLAGLPQISIPAAEVDGLPVGFGIMGWNGGDEALIELAEALSTHCQIWSKV